jgi:outer membrane murein-binding lipoprotein Lpp
VCGHQFVTKNQCQVSTMKKQIIFIFISIFLFSCGSKDKQARLQELEAQRDALDKKIEELRAEIGAANGHRPVPHV